MVLIINKLTFLNYMFSVNKKLKTILTLKSITTFKHN